VLATTDRQLDDELAAVASDRGIPLFRGSETNVADRFLRAMLDADADAAIRVNGDSPLHRARLLAGAVDRWRATQADLVTNVPGRTWPYGLSLEVVGRPSMERAVRDMTTDAQREHVTAYFYDHADEFDIELMPAGDPALHGVDLAVDDEQGLRRFDHIVRNLGPDLAAADPLELARLGTSFMELERA
jgi:spore coat polysaccharide biosynthesis protein SpsF (cytidylyltransferase family)